ncbi:hypothetical protein Tsubulata_032575 [Turnera subulata]|uniref:DRBM domain-containing protein n=1 Tax=Turnera subulata TaxID=218843 RepID=A0A9Q0FR62_9ROSI|nr:hypothetical protein Tsubulata_032575 [Turnera subulata]
MQRGLPEHLMYKNKLQEYTQRCRLQFPIYHNINEGYDHAPKFKSRVVVDGVTYETQKTFKHLKEAEQEAARIALECIKENMKGDDAVVPQDSKHFKSILYEYAARVGLERPKYRINQEDKSQPIFFSTVFFNGKLYKGEVARSKKEAEQQAAGAAIQALLESDTGVLRQMINCKSKRNNAALQVRPPSFKQGNRSVVKKSVEYYQELIKFRETSATCSSMPNHES